MSEAIAPVPPDVNVYTPDKNASKETQTLLLNAKTSVTSQYVDSTYKFIQPQLDAAKAIGGPTS